MQRCGALAKSQAHVKPPWPLRCLVVREAGSRTQR
jgi:hypothetical protein